MKKGVCVVLVLFVMGISIACSNKVTETKAMATMETGDQINYSEDFERLIDKFCEGQITYEECREFYESIEDEKVDDDIGNLFAKCNDIHESKKNFKSGQDKYENKELMEAYKAFDKVISDDTQYHELAQEKKKDIISTYFKESDRLSKGYFYDEAINYLEALNDVVTDSPIVKEKIDYYNTKKEELVLYEGEIRNIFFHSLIVFPELAFDGDWMETGYNYWMTTVSEFKKMLEQMYERDFILIDVHMIYETAYIDDQPVIKKKDLYLPKGKKPLILSLDDLNYYDYMEKDGFADRLVLDEKGHVATYTKLPDGGELVERDNDCVPILDVFVEEHPDFSYRNAKGIIGLTGYEGILGYRTDLFDSPTFEQDMEDAKAVVERLQETGWLFASHSYGHINFGERTLRRVKKDTKQWNDEVASIVGKTNLFIYPYGATVSKNDSRFQHLQYKGFQIFFGVGGRTSLNVSEDSILMDRCNLDGYRMNVGPKGLEDLFDVKAVYDKSRPDFE